MGRSYGILAPSGEKFAIHLDRPVMQGGHAVIHRLMHASSTPAVENLPRPSTFPAPESTTPPEGGVAHDQG